MFDCKIYLCAFLYSSYSPQPFVVSSTPNQYNPLIGNITNNNLPINDDLFNLVDEFIGISPLKVPMLLREVEKQEQQIILHYVCNLPIDCKTTKAYNIPYQTAMHHPIIKKSIAYV